MCTYISYMYPLFQYRLRYTEEHDHESEEEITEEIESSEEDERSNASDENLHLSEYEIKRKNRIAANKKRFEEHFAAITAKKIKVYPT